MIAHLKRNMQPVFYGTCSISEVYNSNQQLESLMKYCKKEKVTNCSYTLEIAFS